MGGAKRLTLRFSITAALVTILVVTTGAITAVLYFNGRASLLLSSRSLLDQVAGRVNDKTASFLVPVERAARLGAEAAGVGLLHAGRPEEIEAVYFAMARAQPELASLDFGDARGNFLMVKRMPDGGLATKHLERHGTRSGSRWTLRAPGAGIDEVAGRREEASDPYDPRVRPWYRGAMTHAGVFWTDVYLFATDRQPAITAAVALREAQGVTSASTTLGRLSRFLESVRPTPHARVFVVDRGGRLVGSPGLPEVLARAGTLSGLPALAAAPAPDLVALAASPGYARALDSGAGARLELEAAGRRYIGALRPLSVPAGAGWMIGIVLPEDDLLGAVKQGNLKAMSISLAGLAISLVLALFIAHRITRPLRFLVAEAESVRRLELDERRPPAESRFRELSDALDAFSDMKQGLRAFQKYAPARLVRLLLKTHQEARPGGESAELTLLFSDIQSFSTYAERHPPQEVAEVLGRYLQVMTDTLREHQGTVDKFIGDGIMAFWNAPLPVSDHAYRGVVAALRCLEALEELRMPELYTRIAVHTARVVVGNFGSEERLNYTAIGDGVNLTARLEGVNKLYGTQLLISQATFERVRGRIECRLLDRVAVKGKAEATPIYEVLGEAGRVEPERLALARRYEAGLRAYLDRDFEAAAWVFEEVRRQAPGDRAAARMGERARRLASAPPAPDWDGVYVLETK